MSDANGKLWLKWLLESHLLCSFYDKQKLQRRDLNGKQCRKFLQYVGMFSISLQRVISFSAIIIHHIQHFFQSNCFKNINHQIDYFVQWSVVTRRYVCNTIKPCRYKMAW